VQKANILVTHGRVRVDADDRSLMRICLI